MTSAFQLWEWLDHLPHVSYVTGVTRVPNVNLTPWGKRHDVAAAVDVSATIGRWQVRVRVGVTRRFPNELPYFQLLQTIGPQVPCQPPHIEFDGNVCYTSSRERLIDRHEPIAVIRESLYLALRTIKRSYSRAIPDEFIDEFISYWNTQNGDAPLKSIQSFFEISDQVRVIKTWRDLDFINDLGRKKGSRPGATRGYVYKFAANNIDEVEKYFNDSVPTPGASGIYIPLTKSRKILPPSFNNPWSPNKLREIVRNSLEPKNLVRLDAILASRQQGQDLIILGIPRSVTQGPGEQALVAIHVKRMRQGHVLESQSEISTVELHPLRVERRDRSFILQRGGGRTGVDGRKILLVGCGSVGGHLALALGAAGVSNFTLVDSDILTNDNIHRHALGRRYLGKSKVKALQSEMKLTFPYVEVNCISKTADIAFEDGDIDVSSFDLIICATGNPTSDLDINERLIKADRRPPFISCWLEPLGIGGHAATIHPLSAGCLQCLYTDRYRPLFNRSSFAAAYQDFAVDTVGCGSFYTPFADLDARRTAEFAARLCIEMLESKHSSTKVYSWKGDSEHFKSKGYKLTRRFEASVEKLQAGQDIVNKSCPVCGKL